MNSAVGRCSATYIIHSYITLIAYTISLGRIMFSETSPARLTFTTTDVDKRPGEGSDRVGQVSRPGAHRRTTSSKFGLGMKRFPKTVTPIYPTHCALQALPYPHEDTTFLIAQGIEKFYATRWRVSKASNRKGAWLQYNGVDTRSRVCETGSDGGSPSIIILYNRDARGSVNLNGDTKIGARRQSRPLISECHRDFLICNPSD